MDSILFVSFTNSAFWSDTEDLWIKTAIYAAKNGHSVSCAIYDWPENRTHINVLENAGCTIINFPNQGRLKRNFIEKIQSKIAAKSLKKYLENLSAPGYDSVIVNLTHFEILAEEIRDWYQSLSRYVLLFHDHLESEFFKPNEINILRNWVTQSALSLFVSERCKRYLEDKLNMVILNGDIFINPMSFEIPDLETAYYKGNHFVISMIAPIDIQYNAQDQLIRAIASPKWMQRNFIINLYGTGKDADRLENLIARKGLTKKVFIKEDYNNEKRIIENSNLILHTTHNSGMPKIIFEAMALCRPLLVSKTGDLAKYVINNNNGWIIKDASYDEIDIALEIAWNERNRWEEMGRRSFTILKKNYPNSVEQKLLQQILYKEVKSITIKDAVAI